MRRAQACQTRARGKRFNRRLPQRDLTMPHLQRVDSLLRSGAHAEAVRELQAFLLRPGVADAEHMRALVLLAQAHHDSSDHDAALACATQAEALAQSRQDASGEAEALCHRAYAAIGLQREALDAAARALGLARACGNARIEAMALRRMSNHALGTGDEAEAQRLLERSLLCAQAAGSADDEFWALNNLSHLLGVEAARLAEAGDPARVRAAVDALVLMVERALTVARATGHWLQQAFALSNLADAFIVVGDRPRARALINDYAVLAREHGFNRLLAFAHLDEARLLRAEGRFQKAVAVLEAEAHTLAVDHNEELLLATEEALVQLHKEQGQFERALYWLESVVRRQHARLTQQSARQVRVLLAKLDLEQARVAADEARAEARQHSLRATSLELERDVLQRTSREDALTGVGNRRAAEEALGERVATAARGGEKFFVAFVDIDHFKQVNDTLGHAMGDRVLQALGELMRGFLRNRDEVFRFGGEEFVLLMVDGLPHAGWDACERLRRLVEAHDWSAISPQLRVTASFGVAWWQGETSAGALLERADAALYAAKREGRNRVVEA
jgi:diguanylate cyclase (GGDEF)-like protein